MRVTSALDVIPANGSIARLRLAGAVGCVGAATTRCVGMSPLLCVETEASSIISRSSSDEAEPLSSSSGLVLFSGADPLRSVELTKLGNLV